MQLDAEVVNRDWRWNCQRTFERRLGGGVAELFFIDTSPAVQKYYNQPWANFTGGGDILPGHELRSSHLSWNSGSDPTVHLLQHQDLTSRPGCFRSGSMLTGGSELAKHRLMCMLQAPGSRPCVWPYGSGPACAAAGQ